MALPILAADVEAALERRYSIGPQIASGARKAVYRASRHFRPDGTSVSDDVLLKFFPTHEDTRVQAAIAALQGVSHPSLARLLEHGCCCVSARQMRYLAWEFVPGQTLSDCVKRGPLPESKVLAIGRDIAAAIAAIWAMRIVHGAITPSNIMLKDSGGAVLLDVGEAYLDQESRPGAGYLSPEQARGDRHLAYASDIFSLGVVMLESLLGRHPTDNQQSALAYGLRASGGTLTASVGLVCMLDKMLSPRPVFRPIPADLTRNFERLLQKIEAEAGMGTRAPQQRLRA